MVHSWQITTDQSQQPRVTLQQPSAPPTLRGEGRGLING